MRRPLLSAPLALAFALLGSASSAEDAPPPPTIRGVGLTMHSKDPTYDYGPFLAELPALGVTDVCVFVHFYQPHGRSPQPARHPLKTPTDRAILSVLRTIRRLGLRAALLPIVLLERPRADEWRGNIAPPDRRGRTRGDPNFAGPFWDPWWRGYRREVLHFARLAQEGGATLFCVGSELSSTEGLTRRWENLIDDVRRVFSGRLTYSANWDHYQHPRFWKHLDCIGLSGYYELSRDPDAPQEELSGTWLGIRQRLLDWRADRGLTDKPFLFLEIGYPSLDGGAVKPWDYTQESPPDLEEQRMAYQAFADAWRGRPELLGVFFYEWWGRGGPQDRGYTPRGKPALEVLRAFFATKER